MLAASPAEESLATLQSGASLAMSPSDPTALWQEKGKLGPLYLASRLQDTAAPSQYQCC